MYELWFHYYHYNTGGGGGANNGYFKMPVIYANKEEALKQHRKLCNALRKKKQGSKIGERYLLAFLDKNGIDGFFQDCLGVYEVTKTKLSVNK